MNCFLCGKIAEYSCGCSSPSKLICYDCFRVHLEDKSKLHTLKALVNPKETSLYIACIQNLHKLQNTILSTTQARIQKIIDEAQKENSIFRHLIISIEENYLHNTLTPKAIEGIIENLQTNPNCDF